MTKFPLKTTILLCIMAISIITCFRAEAQLTRTKNSHPAHNLVWDSKLYRGIEFLSDTLCNGRASGTRGSVEAAAWIIRSFRKAGVMPLDSTYAKHIYVGQGLVGHNIMGMVPGSKKDPCDSYIIVGSHYDHLGNLQGNIYPGADENASGVVTVTTLADMFASMKTLGRTYGKNIIFVLFDGRQKGLTGSEALWRMLNNGELHDPLTGKEITPEKISLMVNIEQIGSSLAPLKSGRKDYIIMLGRESLPKERQGLLPTCNWLHYTDLEIAHDYYGSKTFTDIFYKLSDQKVFVENRIPAVLFTSGITMNTNRTYDTVDTLDIPILHRRIILIFHWLERMVL